MRVGLRQITPPTTEQVGLQEAKDHLNVTITDDDPLIQSLISEARDYVERMTSMALLTQTWEQIMDGFPCWWSRGWIELQRSPLQSVTSVTYIDSTGASIVWPSSNYVAVDGSPPRLSPAFGKVWPAAPLQPIGGVVIRFVAGFASIALVPPTLREAQMLMVGHWYQNREAVLTGTRLVSIETLRAVEDILGIHSPPLMA